MSQFTRNRIPCQRDAGTRLATALRRRPFSACNKGNRRRLRAGNSYQAQEQDVPRVHPLNRLQVHGKGPRNGEVICHRKVQQSFLNQSLDTPAPLPITSGLVSYAFSDFRALKGKTILTGASCLSDTCCLGQYLLNQYLLMMMTSTVFEEYHL